MQPFIILKVFIDDTLIDEYRLQGKEISIGRNHENDVVLKGDKISRYHCSLALSGKNYYLHDTSRNGVYLNGVKVKEQAVFSPGDVITIYPYKILTAAQGGRAAAPASTEDSETVFLAKESNAFVDFLGKRFKISPREYEVIEFIIYGKTNKEIAELLGISDLTIKTHLKNIFQKTGVIKRTQLISKVLEIKNSLG